MHPPASACVRHLQRKSVAARDACGRKMEDGELLANRDQESPKWQKLGRGGRIIAYFGFIPLPPTSGGISETPRSVRLGCGNCDLFREKGGVGRLKFRRLGRNVPKLSLPPEPGDIRGPPRCLRVGDGGLLRKRFENSLNGRN